MWHFSVCFKNYQSIAKQHHYHCSDKIIVGVGSSQKSKSWSSHLHSTCRMFHVKRNLQWNSWHQKKFSNYFRTQILNRDSGEVGEIADIWQPCITFTLFINSYGGLYCKTAESKLLKKKLGVIFCNIAFHRYNALLEKAIKVKINTILGAENFKLLYIIPTLSKRFCEEFDSKKHTFLLMTFSTTAYDVTTSICFRTIWNHQKPPPRPATERAVKWPHRTLVQ